MSEKPDLLHIISQRVFILDGAMGTSIQALNLPVQTFGGKAGCNEYLNLLEPDVIQNIHKSFLDVGCFGIETNTFGGSRLKLREYDLEDKVREINEAGVVIAREAARNYGPPKYVFGSIGPTGMLPSSDDPELGSITFDELVNVFEEQASALISGGADALSIETSQDILETKAALIGCRRASSQAGCSLPVIAHVTLDANGRMLLGTTIGSALVTLEGLGADVIGINCSTGPKEMRDSIRFLSSHASVPLSCMPNMGIPENADGVPRFSLEAEVFAAEMEEFVSKFGVNMVGGCCGSTPMHLQALINRVEHISLPRREVSKLHAVSSGIDYVSLHQSPPPLLVGERINAQGSRKMKQLLLADNLDGIAALARDQAAKGAHALDVCVALNELDGEQDRFVRLAKILALRTEAPIMIDSTDSQVLREAIKNYPGRVIVNSINLENGERKISEVGEAIRTYGAYVIALTIDEKGMARTRSEKVAVAERIAGILRDKYSIESDRIIFDPLTFTLATGEEIYRNSAVQTLEGLEGIKQAIPGCLTILGISNVSFGLSRAARAVLNSVFLYHALRRDLDLAIVNPVDITPYPDIPAEDRNLAEDLIFDKNDAALHALIDHYEKISAKPARKAKRIFSGPEDEAVYKIINRHPEGIEEVLDQILEKKDAVTILNTVLLPAMKEVGDKFGKGELILPFVLQSAEVMKSAVNHLEKFLVKKEGYTKGRVVLATVYGDVHDIGKNLVKTILVNNGYEVRDLGKQVPAHRILEEARDFRADAVGLSALLVSTSKQMPIVVQEMYRAGLRIPVIIGGAVVTRQFACKSAVVENDTEYPSGLFYAKDAFEGLHILDRLTDPKTRSNILEDYHKSVHAVLARDNASSNRIRERINNKAHEIIQVDPPEPPFWGARKISDIDLDSVYECMDLKSLYKLSWGIRSMGKEDYQNIVREKFEPLRMSLQKEAKEKGYLRPAAVYGYFPCKSRDDDLLIYDPNERDTVLAHIHFPRQRGKKLLAISDYFRSDVFDVLPLQLVTIGPKASDVCGRLSGAGEYSRSYYLHGLSVEAAEGLAEYIHRLIRSELGVGPKQGKRFSHGYPACPELEDNAILLRLLDGGKNLGVTLTAAYQFVPEQTTAALVAHHPQAEYFSL